MASYTMANAVSACVVSKAFFTPACGDSFNYSPETSDPENLGLYLFQKAQQHYVASFGIQGGLPSSLAAFLRGLRICCARGVPQVGLAPPRTEDAVLTPSDVVVASMTNGEWLEEICLAIAEIMYDHRFCAPLIFDI